MGLCARDFWVFEDKFASKSQSKVETNIWEFWTEKSSSILQFIILIYVIKLNNALSNQDEYLNNI